MILIKNLRIRYYRSLKNISLKNINDLNVFSGKNDSGKSNILKVLSVFFNKENINFSEDYNKERLSEVQKTIKSKQFMDIRITLVPPDNYLSLPKSITVTRTWDRTGTLTNTTTDLESQIKQKKFTPKNISISKRNLEKLLNKIKYIHIPGVRDEEFFSQLLQELQIALFEKEDRRKKTENSVRGTISEFNEYISRITSGLNEDFKKSSKIETNLSFPTELGLLFKRLLINTRSENHDIPLYLRGDGIRLWYIPIILYHIAKLSPNIFIWGFDEPENSCEYSLSSTLAKDFSEKYTKSAQIFVATHSFAFTSLDAKNCTVFRVYKNGELDTKIVNVNNISKQENKLLDEIGVLGINKKLKELYDNFTSEKEQIEKIKIELSSLRKPFLIFEGKTDNILFSIAYQELRNISIDDNWSLCNHAINNDSTSIGGGARAINHFLYNHIGKIPTDNVIIGVFDFDEAGVNEINALIKSKIFEDISEEYNNLVIRHKNIRNVYAITLVTPDFRELFTDSSEPHFCHLTTELLFKDQYIPLCNRRYPTKEERPPFSFKDSGNKTKITFAEDIRANPSNYNFDGFKNTIELLEKIVERNR